MAEIPSPTFIYHITAIDNLIPILASGRLLCKNQLANDGIDYADIAYQNIQGRRGLKSVPVGPGGTLHDYVPFYFAPRSPMLFTINNGNVEGCPYRQDDIVHLVCTVEDVVEAGLPYVFYDMNAATNYSTPYDDIANLDQIDWELFFEFPRIAGYCQYWHSKHDNPRYMQRMETRQAEFLVHNELDISLLCHVGVHTKAKQARVQALLDQYGVELTAEVQDGWYY